MLTWAIIAVAASGGGHATTAACPPSGARTLLQGASVRVYRTKKDEVRACSTGGKDAQLANAFDERTFLPPAMSTAGGRVGYGLYYNDVDDQSATTVEVIDVRAGKTRKPRSYAASSFYDPARVARTSLLSSGTIVWSSCASNAPPSTSPFKASRCPREPGDGTHPVAEVRVGYANGRSRTLDASDAIDPRSIRVHNSRVLWTHGSTTRSFRLR